MAAPAARAWTARLYLRHSVRWTPSTPRYAASIVHILAPRRCACDKAANEPAEWACSGSRSFMPSPTSSAPLITPPLAPVALRAGDTGPLETAPSENPYASDRTFLIQNPPNPRLPCHTGGIHVQRTPRQARPPRAATASRASMASVVGAYLPDVLGRLRALSAWCTSDCVPVNSNACCKPNRFSRFPQRAF